MFRIRLHFRAYCLIGFSLCFLSLVYMMDRQRLFAMLGGVQSNELVVDQDPKQEMKLVGIEDGGPTRFGQRMMKRIEGLVGRDFDVFLKSDVMEQLQFNNVGVLFRAGAEKEGTRIVTGVYPEVFYAGCVIVIETSGPHPHN